jgi:hypothetical protein
MAEWKREPDEKTEEGLSRWHRGTEGRGEDSGVGGVRSEFRFLIQIGFSGFSFSP